MSDIVLHYFGVNGRGEVSRMILHHSGTAFEDKKYSGYEEFNQVKHSGLFEFERLPMLEIDGNRLVETTAIEGYLCRKLGYTNEEPHLIYSSESMVSLVKDFRNQMGKYYTPPGDPEGLLQCYRENLILIEKRLNSNHNGEGFFVGDAPTHADFIVFQTFFDYFYTKAEVWEKAEALFDEHAPKLKAFLTRFPDTSPTLRAYIDQKDKNLPI